MSDPSRRSLRPFLELTRRQWFGMLLDALVEKHRPQLTAEAKQEVMHLAVFLLEDEYRTGGLDVTNLTVVDAAARIDRAVVFSSRTFPAVRRWSAKEVTDDSVQEGMINLLTQYRNWRRGEEPADPKQILQIRWAFEQRERRQQERTVGGDAVLGISVASDHPRRSADRELLTATSRLMRSRPPRERWVYLRMRLNKSPKEIAHATGMSEGHVRVTQNLIRNRLRESFPEACSE